MKYLIEITPPIELANTTDDKGGPAKFFEHIAQRFRPEVLYGSAVTRSLVMIADLANVEDVAELMFIAGRGANSVPRFLPLMDAKPMMDILQRTTSAPRLG